MYVVCVNVYVVAGREDDFVAATRHNHEGSVQESGCLRFDVLKAEDEVGRYFLYEVYRSKDDFKAHQTTEHYNTWKVTVADWMAQPRKGIKHESLFPADEAF
jgi:autoinducer 2-degrading protein